MAIVESGPPLDIGRIVDFESKHEVQLPVPYKSFLLQFNGGRPKPSRSFSWQTCLGANMSVVEYFYTIDASSSSRDLGVIIETTRDALWPDLLAIASDGCGNEICIGIARQNYGQIFFWNWYVHMGYPLHSARDNIVLRKIADDFDEFFSSLAMDEGEAVRRTRRYPPAS